MTNPTKSLARLDARDRRTLALLQADATLPLAEIARRIDLSQTPAWKRIQRLEADGVITGRVALVSPAAIGLGLTAFVSVESADHSPLWLEQFSVAVEAMPEVVDLYRMAGEVDYLLRVVVADIAAFDAFYKRLIAAVPIKAVTSRFAMETIKTSTAYPV